VQQVRVVQPVVQPVPGAFPVQPVVQALQPQQAAPAVPSASLQEQRVQTTVAAAEQVVL